MGAILDLYEREHGGREPVICLDEKPVALFGDTREMMAFSEGKLNRFDYQYSRDGSVNVSCVVESLAGVYFNEVATNKKKVVGHGISLKNTMLLSMRVG